MSSSLAATLSVDSLDKVLAGVEQLLKANNDTMTQILNARIDTGIANLRKEMIEMIEPLQRRDIGLMTEVEEKIMSRVEEALDKRFGDEQPSSQRNVRRRVGSGTAASSVGGGPGPSMSLEDRKEDLKRRSTVMATGFPNDTYSKEVQAFLKEVKEKVGLDAGTVITFGRVTNSAVIEFQSPPEAASFREHMRSEANHEFKDKDGELHKIYFGPRNTKAEDRRQMIQRRIRNVLRKKLEEGGVSEEEVYIERGKGTVRVGRSLVATVSKDADEFQLVAEALRKWSLEEPSVRGEMQVAIERV